MRPIRFAGAMLLCATVATAVSAAPGGVPGPPAGQGQAGQGIGAQVAALAKGGFRGQQLAGQVKGIRAARGIGKQGAGGPGGKQGAGGGKAGKGKAGK